MDENKYRRVLSENAGRIRVPWPVWHSIHVSRYHLDHPYVFNVGGQEFSVQYVPAGIGYRIRSAVTPTGAVRSGCRSTILIIRSLLNLYQYYGDDFRMECPDRFRQADEPF